MSYGLTANDWIDLPGEAEAAPPPGSGVAESGLTLLPADAPAQVARSPLVPVAFAVPVALSAVGYLLGRDGGFMSDLAFVVVTLLCATLLAVELLAFGRRLGIGAILIYGGILIWFCHDYGSNWFLRDYRVTDPRFPSVYADTVGRAMFYHCLFIDLMVIAFRVPVLRSLERVVTAVPEPADPRLYLGLVVGMLLVGWSAFLFTDEFVLTSVAKAGFWFVPGVGRIPWLVGRTNLAVDWGSYVAQIIEVGQVGGMLGGVYALLVARTPVGRAFGWAVWLYWTSYSFQGERRGDIAFMALPVVGILFMKFHAQRDPERRGRALRLLVATMVAVGGLWYVIQWQSADREQWRGVSMFRASGNTMFSEGIKAWALIPDPRGYAYDTWPMGTEMVIRPLPDALFLLVTGPIPRVAWDKADWLIGKKPVEKFALWYSSFNSGDKRGVMTGGAEGTTVSSGAVGYWYFRYGPSGVIQGGLLYGFMMGLAERSLRRAQGRPMKVLFALGFATFLFRSYRDLWWHNLYPMLLGGIVLWVLVKFVVGARPDNDVPVPGSRPTVPAA